MPFHGQSAAVQVPAGGVVRVRSLGVLPSGGDTTIVWSDGASATGFTGGAAPAGLHATRFVAYSRQLGAKADSTVLPDGNALEAQRRIVMSAAMIVMKGRVQKEGEVIRVICDRIIDHGDLLHRVGEMAFPHHTGRGDGARHAGSPDRGDVGWKPAIRNCYWPPHADGMDPEEVVRLKSRDFR